MTLFELLLDTYTAVYKSHKRMFGPTSECVSLKVQKVCNSITFSNRWFFPEPCRGTLFLQFRQSWQTFLRWIFKFYFLKILKKIETFRLFQEKDVIPEVLHLDSEKQYRHLFWKVAAKIRKLWSKWENNFKNHINWSDNHFPQLLFCQRRPVFWVLCWNLLAANPKKIQKFTFPRQNCFIRSDRLERNQAVLRIIRGTFWLKVDNVFCPISDETIF